MSVESSAFVALRDDGGGGQRSLSTNERQFLRQCALARSGRRVLLRVDGRAPGEARKLQLTLGRWHNGAECTVQWGKGTRVTCLVTASLVPPLPDRPSEGIVSISVDLSPMASTSFGHCQPLTTTPGGPQGDGGSSLSNITDESQKLVSNRILRCLERTLLLGGALDTEALCVQSGAWVWTLRVSVTVLDSGGNLLDASVLAAVAALRHYRKPQVDLQSSSSESSSSSSSSIPPSPSPTLVHSDVREPSPLPLHHTPLSMSFALIHADDASLSTSSTSQVAALVDPTDREELVQTGTISLAMNVHSEVCLLDFGGGCELQPSQLKQCCRLAEKNILELCRMLETTLKDADDKAHQERLHRLQLASSGQQHPETSTLLPPEPMEGVPFLQDSDGQDFMQIDTASEWKDVSEDVEKAAAQVQQDQAEEEEAYRLQALDYSLGHVAAKVKDDANERKKSTNKDAHTRAGSLLAAMLQSAQRSSSSTTDDDGESTSRMASESPDHVRSPAAQEEFDQFVKKQQVSLSGPGADAAAAPATEPTKTGHGVAVVDSDDEEETTMLHTEFQPGASIEDSKTMEEPPAPSATTNDDDDDDDDDVDDLAMAIKKKKKKKKKSK